MSDIATLLPAIRRIHERIRDAVVTACEQSASADLAAVAHESDGDTIYAVDRISEDLLIELFEREIAGMVPVVLLAEGLPGGQIILPRGAQESSAPWRILVDPIDGTRGLMYQKRSAWILTGVARNQGTGTRLSDIELAVQTEIPLVKQHLCDVAWAQTGRGARAERYNRLTGQRAALPLRPSHAGSIAHGFAMLARFVPGARDELAAIDEEIVRAALGPIRPGKAACFEDQYICTGGQFFELMTGHDRFVADIRPLMERSLAAKGERMGLCCHPYDVCTELIARELGVIVTNEHGERLQAPLKIEPDICWIGYANDQVRRQVEPLLQAALKKRGLL
jgi:fructose-1,6-bisphosphatase/inositol monophosphatase family enzyme